MRRILSLIGLTVLFAVSGCASAMNPYSDSFTCPFAEKGRCESLQKAYEDSMKDNSGGEALQHELSKADEGKDNTRNNAYQDALLKRVAGLLEDPTTPFVVNAQALRILILPYRGEDNMLFMPRHVYTFVSKPIWVLDNLDSPEGK